jgi:hypothetical protein
VPVLSEVARSILELYSYALSGSGRDTVGILRLDALNLQPEPPARQLREQEDDSMFIFRLIIERHTSESGVSGSRNDVFHQRIPYWRGQR